MSAASPADTSRPPPAPSHRTSHKKHASKAFGSTRSPADFLNYVLGRPVVVRLNSGVDYKGTLACLDDRMNIAMEHTEEYCGDHLTNRYGDTFIRGNNVLYISAGGPVKVALEPQQQL
eukprot:GHVS01092612.1.p2 GENE.GHVS01092612.1~~GHVS01092612.1.p2  ORF type:complete len:118 (+),score=11.21 GHVS01092612.1:281-634(+)